MTRVAADNGFCTHLFLHVVQGVGGVDSEADEDNVGVGVGERAETIVILLARRIPQGELNVFAINLNIRNVVLEHSWYVDLLAPISSQFQNNNSPWLQRTGGREESSIRKVRCETCQDGRTSGKVPLEKTMRRQVCVPSKPLSVSH